MSFIHLFDFKIHKPNVDVISPTGRFFVSTVIGVLWLCFPSEVANAQSVESIYSRRDYYVDFFGGFEFPPPEQLLISYRLKWFREAVARGECGIAAIQLATGFRDKNPSAPNSVDSDKAVVAFDLMILPRYYPATFLCRTLERLKKNQAEIDRQDLWAPRLKQSRDTDEFLKMSIPAKFRNGNIESLVILALEDYAPAQVTLSQMSERGDAIRLTPGFNYYILARAKRSGLQSTELDRLLIKAEAKLNKWEKVRIGRRVERGAWPRADPLVMD